MKCKNCNAEITFWTGLKQPTPFRFKCSTCKATYGVSTPRMMAIFIGMIVLFADLTLGLCIGTDKLGAIFAVPFLFLMIGILLVLEMWTQRYISKYGTFTRIGITEKVASVDGEHGRHSG